VEKNWMVPPLTVGKCAPMVFAAVGLLEAVEAFGV